MQVAVLNRRAQRKYEEFKQALAMVAFLLENQAKEMVEKIDDNLIPPNSWSMPTKEEVEATRHKALNSITALRKTAKKYEAELISREWRV